jgi:hypothetical protein
MITKELLHEGMILTTSSCQTYIVKCWDKEGVYLRAIPFSKEPKDGRILEYSWNAIDELFGESAR